MSASTITTDPIADMLSRLRNGLAVGAKAVDIPDSRLKRHILKVLKETGFIVDFKPKSGPRPTLEVRLSSEPKPARISYLRRLSKPGRRIHVKAGNIPTVRGGQGLVIISTSQGMMAGHAARARSLGGELICEVW